MLILTPVFSGDCTGAAVYYTLLTNWLLSREVPVTIVSEATGENVGDDYMGIFPKRCGKNKRIVRDLAAYACQNLIYFRLPNIVKRKKPKTVLIHASFYNLPGVFPYVIRSMLERRVCNERYLIDVRGFIPAKCMHHLLKFDQAIACSENVLNALVAGGLSREKIQHIPVLQERFKIDKDKVQQLLTTLGLKDKTYILYVGLIKEQKAVDILLEAFARFVQPLHPSYSLVLAGLLKTSNKKIIKLLKSKNVYYIGNRSREEALHLMAGASLCVNLSPAESTSRFCLESIALKRPTILPPKVPEYMRFCPDFVATSCEPKEVAQKMMEVLESGEVPSYPIEQHLPEQVLPKYAKIFGLDGQQ